MGYEDSLACKLLATHCCCCRRPLVDAASVELGIGPDCRKKYMREGMAEHRDEANKIVHGLALVVSGFKPELVAGLSTEVTQAAYALGGTKAVGAMLAAVSPEGAPMLQRLRDIGFEVLADKLEEAWLPIRITEVGSEILVAAPYSDDAVAAQRKIQGRRWDKAAKCNRFPATERVAVWSMLKRCYAGVAGVGPKGAFVVPA